MSSLEAVVWDMDGVLVDTGEFHFKAWKTILARYEVAFSRETFTKTFGMNNEGILKSVLGDRYSDELYKIIDRQKEVNFREILHGNVTLLPGVISLLEQVRNASIPQAIASSAPQENIDAVVSELNLQPYFQTAISAANMPGKPDPTVFLTAAQELGVSPSHCIVVEDAIAGVEAARHAGMTCIAVTTTNPAKELQAAYLVVGRLSKLNLQDLQNLINNRS
jgi:beta-phosphoglucomutase family hydrolase